MNEYPSVVRVLSSIVVHGHTLDSSTRTSDSALTRQICYGVLRNYYQLNALVKLLLDKPLPRKHLDLHLLLLAGIYSVLYLDRSFQSSVNIAVEATTDLKKTWAKKLVNGVLRQFLRKKSELLVEIESEPEASSNHPKWLYDRIHSAYPNHADDIIEANNTHPPMTLRVNLLQIERSNYQLLLDENGMQSSKGRMADSSLYLKDPVSVDRLPGFDEGMVSIQDEASQLAASLISLSPQILRRILKPFPRRSGIVASS